MLHIPSRRQRTHIDRLIRAALIRQHRRPRFLPSDTTEIDFALVSINGSATTPPTAFDFSLLTSSCTPQSGGYACSVTEPAPAATDGYTVVACSGTTTGCSGGVTLSETHATFTVPAGGSALGTFSLNPIVGSLAWNGGEGYANGNAAPSWNGSAYSCSSACWDPLLNNHSTALDDSLSLVALDADGETIIPASGGGSGSGTPYVPLYLTQSGAVDSITVTCGDGHVEYMNGTGTLPASSPLTSQLANGFGNGTLQSTNHTITSPVTGSDGLSGTVLSGSTATVYGNDGAFVNYDGGGSGYLSTSVTTCTASDSNSVPNTATYYVGFAAGS